MKDQKRLLHKCLLEDIPAFVICGTDICSVQAMEAYYQIAVEKGCNSNFLENLKLAIEDFKAFNVDRKSTRLNSSHNRESRMPSSA